MEYDNEIILKKSEIENIIIKLKKKDAFEVDMAVGFLEYKLNGGK